MLVLSGERAERDGYTVLVGEFFGLWGPRCESSATLLISFRLSLFPSFTIVTSSGGARPHLILNTYSRAGTSTRKTFLTLPRNLAYLYILLNSTATRPSETGDKGFSIRSM